MDTYFIPEVSMGNSASDPVSDNEVTIFSGNTAWSAGADKNLMVSVTSTLVNMTVRVASNQNTVDGANLRVRVAGTDRSMSDGNGIVTDDQASAIFIDD